ncbi:Beta-1,2-xylosyltransferase 1 [Cytospora mali]|uniref:Beta-1,2-xylosyltransferase 1 n=1 Tax=Cytospora mali TaxID=578113 RepID=A0A194VXI7_CYTMA|nr:Beta-1,2-xylosyltransferase 1 [Valsa mali]
MLFPTPPEFVESTAHPVEILHQEAIKDFQDLLSRQSRTVDEAIEEYTERYGRSPPPGFNKWAKYALKQRSPIIDDFDTILENLEPFYRLSPGEFKQLMKEATMGGNPDVFLCSYSKKKSFEDCGYFGETMDWLLDSTKKRLPDMVFPVNSLDEPSLLLKNNLDDDAAFYWRNLASKNIVGHVAEACIARGHTSTDDILTNRVETYGLPFVQSVEEEQDLCLHPEYKDYHGFLNSPTSLRQLGTAVPLLSRAAPYPFADVLMPSPHYAFPDNLYNGILDSPWHQKKNAVFWHGSTTGGHWHKDVSWKVGHRQRFAALITMPEYRTYTYLERNPNTSSPEAYRRYTTREIDRALYDVHISSAIQCDWDQCDELMQFFHVGMEPPPAARPYEYRFAFDIDGNSYSGRFHKNLAAHTTPLKMSIFREWHDERLVPWLHYVPVSQSMAELPELVRFLAATEEGQRVAYRIAEEGRTWYYRALSPKHQGLYWYRLLLELAWLQDSARTVE